MAEIARNCHCRSSGNQGPVTRLLCYSSQVAAARSLDSLLRGNDKVLHSAKMLPKSKAFFFPLSHSKGNTPSPCTGKA